VVLHEIHNDFWTFFGFGRKEMEKKKKRKIKVDFLCLSRIPGQ
jgi:hypothetical protein